MNREDFLENFKEVLQTEDSIDFDTSLADLEEWDSLSIMATIAFLDNEFKKKVSFKDVKSFKTVADIAKKVGL